MLSSLLEKIFGKEFVAKIDTPHIYERPRVFYAYICYFFSIVFMLILFFMRKK